MNELINWVTRNNTLMIQSGFTIVLLLIVIYIYRLFFVSSEAPSGSSGSSNGDVNRLNEKIEQLLQQKITNSSVATSGAGPESKPSDDGERLQAEVATLRAALNESEKKVFELSPTADSAALEANTLNQEQVTVLTKKVEQLEARLAEYDIISDDIAELSQLRSENSELKGKLGIETEPTVAKPAVDEKAEVSSEVEATDPIITEEPQKELNSDEILDEVLAESGAQTTEENIYETPAAEAEEIIKVSDDQALPDLDLITVTEDSLATDPIVTEPLPEISLDSDPIIVTEEAAAEEVSENDKNILNDFEKVIKRGST